ncbi:MAG: DUF6164 family protein [Mariprofundaceae bacterium]
MGVLLFKLRNVPDDEAGDIRELLSDHKIDFYETSAGGWGISMPAIWLHDETHLQQARSLLDAYQQQRQKSARQTYEQLRQKGEHRTIRHKVKEAPLLTIIYLAAVLIILYISLVPFLGMFR